MAAHATFPHPVGLLPLIALARDLELRLLALLDHERPPSLLVLRADVARLAVAIGALSHPGAAALAERLTTAAAQLPSHGAHLTLLERTAAWHLGAALLQTATELSAR